jgi:hypothetical protein
MNHEDAKTRSGLWSVGVDVVNQPYRLDTGLAREGQARSRIVAPAKGIMSQERGHFELEPDNRDAADEVLLEDLRRVASALGRSTVTWREYRNRGRFGSETIRQRFGSWNKALEQAGLGVSKRHRIPDVELFENLERIWVSLGRQPHRSDLDRCHTIVSHSVYEQRFGGWRKALEAFVAFVEQTGESGAVPHSNDESSTRRTPREPNLRLKFLVMRRDGFRCQQYGRSPATHPGVELHVDHKLAWSAGGETEIGNLRTLCADCNLGKSNLAASER